ncbi:MAG TPA: Gfo/Idh/MocA family oxidoreductase [Acidimicrobiales bacterium]|nr:Gfo/Idh/MocA family oxidoreductase [Acidimicrobiales bacterium]
MSSALQWGIIGTGRIARTFASDLSHIDDGVVAAVGSRSLTTAEEFATELGVPVAHGSYEELVADPRVEAVYVATPHPMHFANARLALDAGKPVLVEKAFTMTVDEAVELVAIARERGLFLMEAMWSRFLPHIEALRGIVRSGELGEIVEVIADHGKWFEKDPTSRLFAPELGGSAMLDLGVYPVSFASMILGTPARVAAMVTPAFSGVDATASAVLGYDNGAQAIVTCTSSARSATRASVVGTLARVEIDGDFYAPSSLMVIPRSGEVRRLDFATQGRGLQYQASHVAALLAQGRTESDVMPLDESIAIMGTMRGIMES